MPPLPSPRKLTRWVLLQPGRINAYAQAVIRTLCSAENDLGRLPLRSIAERKLIYQSIGRDGVPVAMKRLPPAEERVVLGEMERQLEQRGLCLRQGYQIVFPIRLLPSAATKTGSVRSRCGSWP